MNRLHNKLLFQVQIFKDGIVWLIGIFFFINSELDKVWHHQTCQINLNGEMGSIGKASEFNMINKKLKNILQKKESFQ